MSKFNFNFYLDIRKPLKSGNYSIKVNLYDSEIKKTINFTIKKVSGIEVSASQSDWKDIWVNKDKKDSFGEITGENFVYGRKSEIRTILKAKQDLLNDIITRPSVTSSDEVKQLFFDYKKPNVFLDDVYSAFESYIAEKVSLERFKTAKSYSSTLNNLKRYMNEFYPSKSDKPLRFYQITPDWLNHYDNRRRQDVSTATIGVDMRNLRAVYNKSMTQNTALQEIYPFKSENYNIPSKTSKNIGLRKDDLLKLKEFSSDNYYLQMARDYFLFSYFGRGLNLKDIAKLKKGQEYYIRSKTEYTVKQQDEIKIKLNEEMHSIVDRHKGKGDYLFDILDPNDSEADITRKVDSKIGSIDKQLKKLAKILDLPEKLSYQWARHSYATNLLIAGVNKKAISESLGHKSQTTSENYFDSLIDENEKNIEDALEL